MYTNLEFTLLGLGHVVLLITLGICTVLIFYSRWHYGTLESLGIPFVPPHWLLGSNYFSYRNVTVHEDMERSIKYGPVYGLYEGRKPLILVNDPDVVRLVLVKDHESFRDRRVWAVGHPVLDELLDFQPHKKWKAIRSMVTPAFSLTKIKTMGSITEQLASEYVGNFEKTAKARQKIDMRNFIFPLSANMANNLFLGVQLEDKDDPQNFLAQVLKSLSVDSITETTPSFLHTIYAVYPFIGKLMSAGPFSIPLLPGDSVEQLSQHIQRILTSYKNSNLPITNEVVTMLLKMSARTSTPEFKSRRITDVTVVANAFEFFIGLYEGVFTGSVILSYYLAKNPEIQETLLREIDEMLEANGGEISQDVVSELPYLSACILETFRIFPTFHRIERICTQDWTYPEMNLRIKKGISVFISLWSIQHNAKYFPDPEKFLPERFLPANKEKLHPYAFGGFGHGPKQCPGYRLALAMLKVFLCRLLKNFKFEEANDTKLEFLAGFGPFLKFKKFHVDIVKRRVD